jgi:hypothetical protein
VAEDDSHIIVQLADKYGYTNTNYNLVTSSPDKTMNNGLPSSLEKQSSRLIIQNEEDPASQRKKIRVFILPDKDGAYSSIQPLEIEAMRSNVTTQLQELGSMKRPTFFLIDPSVDMTIETRDFLVELYKQIGFHFIPLTPSQVEHSECVHFTKRKFPPEIIAGTQITKLHIHQTENPIPDEFKMKTKGTPVFKTSIMGATLFMFRMGVFLMCQLHLPAEINNGVMGDGWRDRLFYSLFSELRQLRTPLDFEITIDTGPYCNNSRQMYLNLLSNTLRKVPSFLIPNERCMFPFPVTGEEQIDTTDPFCLCLSCANDEKYNKTCLGRFQDCGRGKGKNM